MGFYRSHRSKPEHIRASEQRLYLDIGLRRCEQAKFLDAKLIRYPAFSCVRLTPALKIVGSPGLILDREHAVSPQQCPGSTLIHQTCLGQCTEAYGSQVR